MNVYRGGGEQVSVSLSLYDLVVKIEMGEILPVVGIFIQGNIGVD